MNRKCFDIRILLLYVLIITGFLIVPLIGNHAITVLSENSYAKPIIVIDAGHGGVDGGAVSCTGIYESHINLQIASKLDHLMHFMGVSTIMIRETDKSVYTQGQTIAAKKISDIKERVRLVNNTPNAILVSIHQNSFPDARYSGAQVFYNHNEESIKLAESLQNSLRKNLNPANSRKTKQASGVYLMDHINCAGILVECGFLSNYEEEALLKDTYYQNKVCAVIATTVAQYLNT